MEKIAIYAGSFCPFTKGHEDIVAKALPLFDKVIIGIGHNIDKKEAFSESQRQRWIQGIYNGNPKIEVIPYTGLTIELCHRVGARYLIRGVRDIRDYAAEQELAEINKRLAPDIETLLFFPSPEARVISSTMVRELWQFGADYSPYLSYELPAY